jgi:hypothetical protein
VKLVADTLGFVAENGTVAIECRSVDQAATKQLGISDLSIILETADRRETSKNADFTNRVSV